MATQENSGRPRSVSGDIQKGSSTHEMIKIFVGTWNMGNAAPPEDLSGFLNPEEKHDIYVIGLQDKGSTDVDIEDHPLASKLSDARALSEQCLGPLLLSIQQTLGDEYKLVQRASLLAIRLIVFVHKNHAAKVADVKSGTRATGIMNVYGNKGGVGIGMNFYGTRLFFVSCHLAAHQNMSQRRNQDMRMILEGLCLHHKKLQPTAYYHHVFVLGDLNYRINGERDAVLQMIREDNFRDLIEVHDQAIFYRKKLKLLTDFEESEIRFRPTYKYEPGDVAGANRFYSDEKMRVPSYCDRIFYLSHSLEKTICTRYTDCKSVVTSDHAPVCGSYLVEVVKPLSVATERYNQICHIEVNNFEMGGLKLNVEDDYRDADTNPYIRIFGDFLLEADAKSRPKHKPEMTPVWKSSVCPKVRQCDPWHQLRQANEAGSSGARARYFLAPTAYALSVANVQTTHPEWSGKDLPVLISRTSDVEYLKRQYIIVAVYSKRKGFMRKSILLGECTIPLAEACGDKPHCFQTNILLGGCFNGFLRGQVHVHLVDRSAAHRHKSVFESARTKLKRSVSSVMMLMRKSHSTGLRVGGARTANTSLEEDEGKALSPRSAAQTATAQHSATSSTSEAPVPLRQRSARGGSQSPLTVQTGDSNRARPLSPRARNAAARPGSALSDVPDSEPWHVSSALRLSPETVGSPRGTPVSEDSIVGKHKSLLVRAHDSDSE